MVVNKSASQAIEMRWNFLQHLRSISAFVNQIASHPFHLIWPFQREKGEGGGERLKSHFNWNKLNVRVCVWPALPKLGYFISTQYTHRNFKQFQWPSTTLSCFAVVVLCKLFSWIFKNISFLDSIRKMFLSRVFINSFFSFFLNFPLLSPEKHVGQNMVDHIPMWILKMKMKLQLLEFNVCCMCICIKFWASLKVSDKQTKRYCTFLVFCLFNWTRLCLVERIPILSHGAWMNMRETA